MRSRSSRVANSTTTLPRFAPIVDLHPRVEVVRQQLLELEQPGRAQREPRFGRRRRRRRRRSSRVVGLTVGSGPDRLLDRPHRPALGDGLAGQLLLEGPVGRAEQRPGVAGAEPAVGHEVLDAPGGSCSSRSVLVIVDPALADPAGHLLVGEAEVVDQLLVGRRPPRAG